jgi:hypothetical protein
MDVADLEALVTGLYDELGLDPERPPSAFRIARAWLGAGSVERVHALAGPPATRYRVGGQTRIAVKRSLPDAYANFFCGHELGHLLLQRVGAVFDEHDEERAADYLGACVVLPRAYVMRVYRAEGFAPRVLAEECCVTETAGALRFGEVVTLPLAVDAPTGVRKRGPEHWVWPDDQTVHRWATPPPPPPGLARVRLTDQPRRVALLADEDVREVG